MLLIGIGLALGWFAFIPFALAITLVASYLLIASLWIAYNLNDSPDGNPAERLIALAEIHPEEHVVCIDLGLRETAILIAQHLTSGGVTVIDVYNPQSNNRGALRRARSRTRKPPADPRLAWIDGSINLLPLPDRSVKAVYMNQILSEFWLPEERAQLLSEVGRILMPEGRLLFAERIRSQTDPLLTGLITYSLPPAQYWRELLRSGNFIIQREETVSGLVYCARADKPSPARGKQMTLKLEYV